MKGKKELGECLRMTHGLVILRGLTISWGRNVYLDCHPRLPFGKGSEFVAMTKGRFKLGRGCTMMLIGGSVRKMLLMVVVELDWSVWHGESVHSKSSSSSSLSSKFIVAFRWCGMELVLEIQACSSMTFWKVCKLVSASVKVGGDFMLCGTICATFISDR